jgi:hypothetical protein
MARHAYWVILAGTTPTAFRSSSRDVLVPTLRQLQRTQPDVTLRWFERGRLWESPEAARFGSRARPPAGDRRGEGWRPGGDHRDPHARFELTRDQRRARFKDRARRTREQVPPGGSGHEPPAPGSPPPPGRPRKPWASNRPLRRPWAGGPPAPHAPSPKPNRSFKPYGKRPPGAGRPPRPPRGRGGPKRGGGNRQR